MENKGFNASMKRLEQIVSMLERNEIELEELKKLKEKSK